jgi:hypothetical protein
MTLDLYILILFETKRVRPEAFLALLADIRFFSNGLAWGNVLAYFGGLQITTIKSALTFCSYKLMFLRSSWYGQRPSQE